MENIFAQRLRELRRAQNVSAKDLSQRVGLKKQTVSGYEHAMGVPSFSVLFQSPTL
ncbi:MAG: helix-turn-helix domain-containing protein [Deltaproteobacteria bacterium]|nr:helix-turn-helix domain-containing protein [Deltaproteobacteria bacterium]